MRLTKYIMPFSVLLLTVDANALPSDTTCDVIEAAINYRFLQENGNGVCGKDAATGEKLCLRNPSDSYFVSTELFKLKEPLPSGSSAPELGPAIKLEASVKKQLKSKYREASMSRVILGSRREVERAKSEDASFSKFLIGMAESDFRASYYERKIKFLTKKYGVADSRVLDMEQSYASHQISRKEALSKTTSELEAEVSYVDQVNFDLMHKHLQEHSETKADIGKALRHWYSLNWLGTVDCVDKVNPKNTMMVRRDDEFINVKTGKVIPRFYVSHPKSFHARSLAITPDGDYAFIKVSGHKGGSAYGSRTPPPTYLLKKISGDWHVISSSDPSAVFY